jgi:hypothetical protein
MREDSVMDDQPDLDEILTTGVPLWRAFEIWAQELSKKRTTDGRSFSSEIIDLPADLT